MWVSISNTTTSVRQVLACKVHAPILVINDVEMRTDLGIPFTPSMLHSIRVCKPQPTIDGWNSLKASYFSYNQNLDRFNPSAPSGLEATALATDA